MLRKVLKYDIRAIWLPWLVMSGTALLLSVAVGFSLRSLITYHNPAEHFAAWMPFSAMLIFLGVIAIIAYSVISTILLLVKFYQNFFTDEGYLTFTLPVKRSTLLNSKLLTGLIITAGTTIVTVICVVIALLIAPEAQDGSGCLLVSLCETLYAFISLMLGIPSGWMWSFITVGILLVVVSSLFSGLLIYASIVFGCLIAKKMKVLASIGVYYVASIILSSVTYVLTLVNNSSMLLLSHYFVDEAPVMAILLIEMAIAIMMVIIATVFLYRFILSKLEKNLNLA